MSVEIFPFFGKHVSLEITPKGGSAWDATVIVENVRVEGGERDVDQMLFLGENYAMVEKPATLLEIRISAVARGEDVINLEEMVLGSATTSGGVKTINGLGTRKRYRIVLKGSRENPSTGKTEEYRVAITDALGVTISREATAEDTVKLEVSCKATPNNIRIDTTTDADSSPLPDLGSY